MQQQRSLWKLLLIGFFAFLVVACKPLASFSVSPDPVKAGAEATFDASASMAYFRPKNNAIVSYAWSFGDGATGTGKIATHTYAAAGTFEVKLTVVDTAGRMSAKTESLVVATGDVVGPTTTVKVSVQGAGGVLLSGAQVTVGSSAAALSDASGVATVNDASVGEAVVVKVSKAGFVPQSLRVVVEAGNVERQLFVPMVAVKEEQSIAQVEQARQYRAETLGASVTLPANALVIAGTNTPATGAARLQLTPWDITSPEMRAMLGNGAAADGNLISAGMMTVDFFDASGAKLQLATGKSATLQMDLPYGSVNNQALNIGSAIPLWHFNETTALWEQDGQGTVVESSTSPVGLAVKATVSHFSTWNWDFYITEGGPSNSNTVTVKCVEADGTGVPCTIVADVTLPDGSKYYHHGGTVNSTSVDADGVTIVLLPLNADIVWTGTSADGRVGTAQSGPNGTVNILMAPPKTSNFVQCVSTTGVGQACTVQLDVTKLDGTVVTQNLTLPASGARVVTGIETTQPLSWAGRSSLALNAANEYVRTSGSATSNGSDNVTISLSTSTVEVGKTLYAVCDATAAVTPFDSNTPVTEGLNECTVNVSVNNGGTNTNTLLLAADAPTSIYYTVTVPTGTLVPVSIPPNLLDSRLSIYAYGTTTSGTGVSSVGADYELVSNFANNEVIPLSFTNRLLIEGPQLLR